MPNDSAPTPGAPGAPDLLRLLAEREELLARLARESAKERADALAALERVNQALREREAELSRALAERQAAEDRAAAAGRDLAQSREDTARTGRERDELRTRLEADLAQLRSDADRRQEQILKLTHDLAAADTARQERERELAQTQERLRAADTGLRVQSDASQTEIRDLTSRLNALAVERDGLNVRLDAQNRRTAELDGETAALRSRLAAFEGDLREQGRSAAAEKTSLETRIQELISSREETLQHKKRLEREVERVEELLEESQSRLLERERALAQQARTSAAERIEARRRIEDAARAEQAARERAAALDAQLQRTAADLQASQLRADGLSAEIKSERDARLLDQTRASDEQRQLDGHIARLREDHSRDQEKLRQLDEALRQTLESLDRERAAATAALQTRESRIARLEEELSVIRPDLARVQAEQAAARELADARAQELAALARRAEETERALRTAETSREETASARAKADTELAAAREKLTGLGIRLEETERTARQRAEEATRLENLLTEREKILAELVGGQSEEVRRYEKLLEEARTRTRYLESTLAASGVKTEAAAAALAGATPAAAPAFLQDELAKLRAETASLSKALDAALRKTLSESGRTAELANQLTRIEGKLSAPADTAAADRERRLQEILDHIRAESRTAQDGLRKQIDELDRRMAQRQNAQTAAQPAAAPVRLDPAEFKRLQAELDQRLVRSEKQINQMLTAFEAFSKGGAAPVSGTPASGTGAATSGGAGGDAVARAIEQIRAESKASGESLRKEMSRLSESLKTARPPAPAVTAAGTPDRLSERRVISAGVVLLVLLAAGFGAVLWRQAGLERRIAHLSPGQSELFTGARPARTLARPEPDAKFPLTTAEESIDLAGRAEGAQGVVLHLDGIFFAAVPVRGGKYLFDHIMLEPGSHKAELWAFLAGGGFSEPLSGDIIRSLPAKAARLSTPPRPAIADLDVERGPTDRREIVLTFDADGAQGAEVILDTLRQKRIQTTVFLTGKFMDKYPGLVRQIVKDGHEVGNHTQTHPHLTTYDQNNRHETRPEVTKEWFLDELMKPAAKFEELTGTPMAKIWRAPYGEVNPQILRWAHELGYRHVGWTRDYAHSMTLDSLDWVINRSDKNYQPGGKIIDRLLNFERESRDGVNGGIVLMHLGTERVAGDSVGLHLPRLIDEWRERGYRFVKVSTWLTEDT